MRHVLCFTPILLIGAMGGRPVADDGDWPQWRGPHRDGAAPAVKVPPQWPEQLKEVYRVIVGEGHASPVIAGGKLFQFSRQGDDEVIRCLDAVSGKERWKHSYAAPYQVDPAAAGHGPGPKVTPTIVDGKVFTQGMSSQLFCLDADGGKVLWHHDLLKEHHADGPQYGTAASLLVDGDQVVAQVGDRKQGQIIAYDKNSGKERWRAPCDGPSYCAPVAADLSGVRQLLTFTRSEFIGLAAKDGAVLWRMPYRTSYEQNIVTPVVWKDRIVIAGVGKPAQALALAKNESGFKVEPAWSNNDLRMYMSSPVVFHDHLFGHAQRGKFVCVDLMTGETRWAEGEMGQYASTVLAGDKLLCLDNTAHLYVLEANPKAYRQLAKLKVSDSPTWAHLAVTPDRLYVKDKTRLIAFEMPR